MQLKLIPFVILLFASMSDVFGQDKNVIELLGAKSLQFDKSMGIDAQRLIGEVRFRHKGALMFCDSAYLYNASNSIDAFGNVRVLQGDTLELLSDKLFYSGNTQIVKVRNNVLLNDKEMTLATNTLDFNRKTGVAVFYDEGLITSKVNENRLISCEGIYNSNTEFFYFREDVELTNPKYVVETDTLDYDNLNEISYFQGPTFIYSDENTIYCENGWYDTKKDISQFNKNAYLDNGQQVLRGDSLWYWRTGGLGRAYENVSITDTTEQYIIRGAFGSYFEKTGKSLVTGRAEFIQYDDLDSLFLHGDTLLAVNDTATGNKIYAYPNVRFYRTDMQGVADSLVYVRADSMIHMFENPVLWSDHLQITGDTIQLKTTDTGIERLYVFDHAFMADRVYEDDSLKYNQIKGKKLTGYFQNNELKRVFINGNGQSLYYAMEEAKVEVPDTAGTNVIEKDSVVLSDMSPDTLTSDTVPADSLQKTITITEQKIIGVNKAICSNIAIYLENKKVQKIRFLVKPDGAFIPLFKFTTEDAFFDGFYWHSERRPKDRYDIFRVETPVVLLQ